MDGGAGGGTVCVVLFDSIHHAIGAERAFGEAGLWCDLVPTPRELSSDCGMALEYREEDAEAARRVLTGPAVRWRGIHRRAAGGFEEVEV
jgi:hypothetical protein